MDFLFDGIASVLSFFYDLTGSYGGAIMLLTLAVMVVVTPLTLKSTRSMIAMQRLQPELRKLQAKHKDDRQKLNEEMMAFYKEHNINPLGGCLPLLVQMPVFIVLYQVLIGLTRQHSYGFDMGQAAARLARDPASGGTYPLFGTFDPKYLDQASQLYRDLSSSRQMNSFGLDLAATFTERFSEGIVAGLPYLILVLLIGVTAWYQQRQIQARNAGSSAMNPQQQMLMKILPFFLPIISLTLPAGLVLYFLVSNLYRIGQQAFITRTMYADGSPKESGGGLLSGLLGGGSDAAGKAAAKEDGAKGNGAKGAGSTKGKGGQGKGGSTKGSQGKDAGGGSSNGSGAKAKGGGAAPSRQAPSRAAPSNQNRSKKKRKRT